MGAEITATHGSGFSQCVRIELSPEMQQAVATTLGGTALPQKYFLVPALLPLRTKLV